MRKNLYLSGLFLCILALCGCGSGGGSVADPMGTATVRFVSENGTVIDTTTVGVNGTITLRARVTNSRSDGTVVPVVNEKVSFVIAEGIGCSLDAASDHTGSDGTATVQYRSGNNTYPDQVRVTTSVGATATISISKSGGSTTPYIKSLSASNKEVVAGQTSVITANVVDGGGNPVSGVLIRFRLTVNNSGAVFADAETDANVYAYTDVGGNATAIYQGGSADPYVDAYDSVVAELSGYSSTMAVEIKRTAGTKPLPANELSVTLAAAPESVSAGQTSVITATVTGDEKAGAQVTLSIPVNSSGAAFINAGGFAVSTITVTASGGGIATVIYRAGSDFSGTAVQDTVQALLVNGSNAAIILTRTATIPSTYTIVLVASSTSVSAGQVSIITATITSTSGTTTTPAAGVTVEFSLPVNSSGATLSSALVTTDGSGKAVVIYRPGNTQVSVQDTVQAAVGTAVSAIAISVKGSSTAAYSIVVTAAPKTLTKATSNSIITANVTNNAGDPISGVTVNFAVTGGLVTGTSVAPAAAITDGSGNAVATFTGAAAGTTGQTSVVTAGIITGTYTGAVIITYP